MKLVRLVITGLLLMLSAKVGRSVDLTWDGGGGADDYWSASANWVGDPTPPNPAGGDTVIFNNGDLGNINKLDQGYTINGLHFTHSSSVDRHTTDLNGNTLVVLGASGLRAGYTVSNTAAVITNGTLQLGSASTKGGLYVGYSHNVSTTIFRNNELSLFGVFNALNAGHIAVGVNYDHNGGAEGLLDLRNADVLYGTVPDYLKADSLRVGAIAPNGSFGAQSRGILRLPEAVTNIHVGVFMVGHGSHGSSTNMPSQGTLDIGGASDLQSITALNGFHLGAEGSEFGRIGYDSGGEFVDYLPPGLTLTVGQSGAPANLVIGDRGSQALFYYTSSGHVVLVNGRLDAHLNNLHVGVSAAYQGGASGLLDLRSSEIVCNGTPNLLKANQLLVGALRRNQYDLYGANAVGTLRLPTAVTAIEVGTLGIGSGGHSIQPSARSLGTLDIGPNSSLHTLTVTNEFVLGCWGASAGRIGTATDDGFLEYLPTGLVMNVGLSNAPAEMYIGHFGTQPMGGMVCTGRLALVEGRFNGYLSTLGVGMNNTHSGIGLGRLDLSRTEVRIGDELNKVRVRNLYIGASTSADGAHQGVSDGTLLLPPEVTELEVGDFRLGDASWSGLSGARGQIDIGSNSALRVFTVTNRFYLATRSADYGRIGYDTDEGFVDYLPTGLVFSVGLSHAPAPMFVGWHTHAPYSGAAAAVSGRLVVAHGSVNAHLSELRVGVNSSHLYGRASGILDFRSSPITNVFAVTGDASIGNFGDFGNKDGKGSVYLPSGTATVGGNLRIGDSHAGSSGLLELFGTRLAVSGNVFLGASGRVTNHVSGVASGLDILTDDENALVLSAGSVLTVLFEADPDNISIDYWGLRMAGNHVDYLQNLVDNSQIIISTDGMSSTRARFVGVHYNAISEATIIGALSPKGTMILFR